MRRAREKEQPGFNFTGGRAATESDDRALKLRAELAIGEYLTRRKKVYPEMPIARLLGALGRYGISAGEAPRALQLIGARVTEVPTFVAKYHYRVTLAADLLERCRKTYENYERSELIREL